MFSHSSDFGCLTNFYCDLGRAQPYFQYRPFCRFRRLKPFCQFLRFRSCTAVSPPPAVFVYSLDFGRWADFCDLGRVRPYHRYWLFLPIPPNPVIFSKPLTLAVWNIPPSTATAATNNDIGQNKFLLGGAVYRILAWRYLVRESGYFVHYLSTSTFLSTT